MVKAAVATGVGEKRKVVQEVSSNSSDSSSDEFSDNDASFESNNRSKQGSKDKGFHNSIDINRVALKEFESNVGDVAKRFHSNKSKANVNQPALSVVKKVTSSNEIEHDG